MIWANDVQYNSHSKLFVGLDIKNLLIKMDSDENKYEEFDENIEYSQDNSVNNDLQESSDDENTQHAKSSKAITDFISRRICCK